MQTTLIILGIVGLVTSKSYHHPFIKTDYQGSSNKDGEMEVKGSGLPHPSLTVSTEEIQNLDSKNDNNNRQPSEYMRFSDQKEDNDNVNHHLQEVQDKSVGGQKDPHLRVKRMPCFTRVWNQYGYGIPAPNYYEYGKPYNPQNYIIPNYLKRTEEHGDYFFAPTKYDSRQDSNKNNIESNKISKDQNVSPGSATNTGRVTQRSVSTKSIDGPMHVDIPQESETQEKNYERMDHSDADDSKTLQPLSTNGKDQSAGVPVLLLCIPYSGNSVSGNATTRIELVIPAMGKVTKRSAGQTIYNHYHITNNMYCVPQGYDPRGFKPEITIKPTEPTAVPKNWWELLRNEPQS